MPQLCFIKCEEVLIEDFAQDEVHECFYPMFEDSVKVVDDEGDDIFFLEADNIEFVPETTKVTIPEGYYAHGVGWRFSEFDIVLNDKEHKLTPADFTWSWYTLNDIEFRVPALKEEVGYLEFEMSSDGRYDEEYTEREGDWEW